VDIAAARDASFLHLGAANLEHGLREVERREAPTGKLLGEVDELRSGSRADDEDVGVVSQTSESGADYDV
jgi:hypothetical protein